MYICLYC